MMCVGFASAIAGNPLFSWNKFSLSHSPFTIQNRSPSVPAPGSQTTLVLAVTSDLHGWLSTASLFPEEPFRGILHIAPVIERLRRKYPHLILLDGGDTLQGSPANYYFTYKVNSGEPLPIVKLMNVLRYNAVVLGNHDLEPPPPILQKNLKSSHFPWLSANLVKENGDPLLPPYHILERQGVRIGILGLTTPGTSMWINDAHLRSLKFQDMFTATQHWVPILKQQERVDLLIGLFHSGHNLRHDQYASLNQGVPLANAAGVIADNQDGFDLIISGHAHRTYPKRHTSVLRNFRTPLVSPGFWGAGVSVIKFFLKEQQRRWVIEKTEYSFIPAVPEPSPKLHLIIQRDLDQVRQYLEAPTNVLLHTIPSKKNFYQCGAALSHDALITQTQEKSVSKNPLSTFSLLPSRWRWRNIPTKELHRPLKRLHLFRWLPYDNFLVQTQLYGQQIQILLGPYRRQLEGRFFPYNSLLAPGGFQAYLTKKENSAILQLQQKQNPLQSFELYPVWMTNYHWNGGGGMMAEALIHPSQKLKETRQTLREFVFSYLKNPTFLPTSCLTFLKKANVSPKQ